MPARLPEHTLLCRTSEAEQVMGPLRRKWTVAEHSGQRSRDTNRREQIAVSDVRQTIKARKYSEVADGDTAATQFLP